MKSILASRMKSRMTFLGLTQEQLAKKAGISQVAIHKLLTEKSLQTRKLVDIARALDVSVEYLTHEGEENNQPPSTQLIPPDIQQIAEAATAMPPAVRRHFLILMKDFSTVQSGEAMLAQGWITSTKSMEHTNVRGVNLNVRDNRHRRPTGPRRKKA